MARNKPSSSTASTANGKKTAAKTDPTTYLARGYSARWLGARANGKPLLQPLTNDEIEQDLRHMSAFWTACQRYQQRAYVALNGIATTEQQQEQLPIRLDPDHDKRLQAQRQKLAHAEVVREALEQEYVALRAHYVETCQHVQQTQREKEQRLKFLQDLATEKANQLAYMRTRVQVARDISSALVARRKLLEERSEVSATGVATSDDNSLIEAWMIFENASKELVGPPAKGKANNVMPWKSRVEPSTPKGVPLLVSAASSIPEKSIAWAFDSDPKVTDIWNAGHESTDPFVNERPLVFLPNHAPETIGELLSEDEDEEEKGTGVTADQEITRDFLLKHSHDGKEVVALQREVEQLSEELNMEGKRNAVSLSHTARYRQKLDEWTTMISILRQETEAVLYRHNVLLASDEVAPRAKEHWEQHEDHNAEGNEHKKAPSDDADEGKGNAVEKESAMEATEEAEDGSANDGDDEGADEGADEGGEDFWNGGNGDSNHSKRDAPEDSPSSRTSKRRKV